MKHFYALITVIGMEFSPVAYARNHYMPEQCSVTDCADRFYGGDETDGYDVGSDYDADYGDGRHDDRRDNDGY